MGQYVERNLNPKETILKNAEQHRMQLIVAWIFGILGCWLLLVPTIYALKVTVLYLSTELAVTNKRVIGKVGWIKSTSLDAPLNKIQNITVNFGFWGKIFGYGTVKIHTAGGVIPFTAIKNADALKQFVMNQIEEYESEKIKAQAAEMAAAMNAGK